VCWSRPRWRAGWRGSRGGEGERGARSGAGPSNSGATGPPEAVRPVRAPRRRTALWAAVVVGALAVGLVAVLATRPNFEAVQARSPLLGKPAPELVAADLDGRTVSLSGLRGRFVLVNFFASWCVPCQHEHPQLVAFTQHHQAAGEASVLGVVFEDDASAVRRFVEERGVDWPMVLDPGGKIALDFGVRGPPESFLVDPNGIVLVKFIGEVKATQLDSLVRQAEQAGA